MHLTETASGQLPGIHQKGSVGSGLQISLTHGLPCVGCDVGGLSKALSKTQVNHKTQTVFFLQVILDSLPQNRSTRLSKAPCYDWRDAQKLAVNNLSAQRDCQTSDKVFTVLFQWCCFIVFRRKRFSACENRKVVMLKFNNFIISKDYWMLLGI